MEYNLKVSGLRAISLYVWVVAYSYGLTDPDMKDTGKMVRLGVLEGSYTRMATAMRATGKMDRRAVLASIFTLMAQNTSVNSYKISRMAMDVKSGLMERFLKGNS